MGFQTLVDLVILDMLDLDIILGMTSLSPYYVMLNYNAKNVTLSMPRMYKIELEGFYKPSSLKLLSLISSKMLGGRECLPF